MREQVKHHRFTAFLALLALVVASLALRGAASWYGRPFPGILVDPNGIVSSFGLPWWDGFRQGLRYPDQALAVDGARIPDSGEAGRAFTRAVDEATLAGHGEVTVQVATDGGERWVTLPLVPFDPLSWWMNAGGLLLTASLYVLAALVAIVASPGGRLARTFAKTTLFSALFLLTVFDYHTTRALVPLFLIAFAMAPMGFFALGLRLPHDVGLLARRPWLVAVLDGIGAALAVSMLYQHARGESTLGLQSACTALFGGSLFFFATTFVVRFFRARGDRRATMRALLVAMVPAYLVVGAAFVLAFLGVWGSQSALIALPALGLMPLSTLYAFIRYDLWGSRALLSRMITRMVIGGVICALAIALGTAAAALLGVPFEGALLAAAGGGIAASALVSVALGAGDRRLFPARAVYKPTIEQLSEELTLITVPEEVGHAVERTVRRWLPCERTEFRAMSDVDLSPDEDPAGTSGERLISRSIPRDELTLPVLFRGKALATLHVGKKRGGALFTSEDVDLLRTIANQAALALAHANSYAELELRRREQAAAWQGEREALVETVAAEIAHEVRYPINFFRSIFRRGGAGQQLDAEEVDIGCEEVERLERLVSGLRRVAIRKLERRAVEVAEIAVKAEMLLRDRLGGRRIGVELGGAPVILCDSDQATQVLVNLLSNALDAAGEEGAVGVAWAASRDGATLTVWDDGPGFAGDPSRVFAPWYTTKPRGTGLGLAITHRIVRSHGWTIDPLRQGQRTCFVIAIPRMDILVRDGVASDPKPRARDGVTKDPSPLAHPSSPEEEVA